MIPIARKSMKQLQRQDQQVQQFLPSHLLVGVAPIETRNPIHRSEFNREISIEFLVFLAKLTTGGKSSGASRSGQEELVGVVVRELGVEMEIKQKRSDFQE